MPDKKKTSRDPAFLVKPSDLKDQKAEDEFVDGVADGILDMVDECRAVARRLSAVG